MSRPAGRPPVIDGFEHMGDLGGGGYADVYLYEQDRPKRRVAIKVLRTDIGGASGAEQFTSEANLMAAVSTHPYIVSIFGADIARDGRPYLVLEYYPGDNLSVRCRRRPLSVPEALRIGVQIAGAVETAHLAGIMHRDIKPANILTSAYGKPGLTDFGISAATADGPGAEGMSIPWSPPELLDDSGTADERSDLWSLAATIYTLLTGRSPFEIPGGDNSTLALMARINHQPLAPTGRDDVPASLERALAAAMSKRPSERPSTVSAFARSLQAVERELRLQPTELDIPEDPQGRTSAAAGDVDLSDATRLRTPKTVDAQTPVTPPQADDTRLRAPVAVAPVEATRLRPTVVETPQVPTSAAAAAPAPRHSARQPEAPRRKVVIAVGLVVVLAVAGAAVVAATSGQKADETAPDPDVVAAPTQESLTVAAAPKWNAVALSGKGASRVLKVTWAPLAPGAGPYRCTPVSADGEQIGPDVVGSSTGCAMPVPGNDKVCAKLVNAPDGQLTSRPVTTECRP